MDYQLVSVSEAAASLGVSPRRVRQLIEQGDLEGRRIGYAWVVPLSELHLRERSRPGAGRPYSQRNVWRLAALLDRLKLLDRGNEPPEGWLEAIGDGPNLRWRPMIRRLTDPLVGAEDRLALLRGRSNARAYHHIHPSLKKRLLDDRRIALSGSHAASALGLDLLPGDMVEGYVRSEEAGHVVDEFALQVAEPWGANLVLRSVGDLPEGHPHVAPRLIVAADLMEMQDARAEHVGSELMDALLRAASSWQGSN